MLSLSNVLCLPYVKLTRRVGLTDSFVCLIIKYQHKLSNELAYAI